MRTQGFVRIATSIVMMAAAVTNAFSAMPPQTTRQSMTNYPLKSRNYASWSQHAEFDREEETTTIVMKDTGTDLGYNLVSPREWLEYQEQEAAAAGNSGGGGAYTVLRCDLLADQTWRIWEKEFHWQRLCDSYNDLLTNNNEHDEDNNNNNAAAAAIVKTENILSKLLDAAQTSLSITTSDDTTVVVGDDDTCCICMITLLWQNEQEKCVVRGHTFSTGVYLNPIEYDPQPITASLATTTTATTTLLSSSSSSKPIPNRYDNKPRSKLSSWCRTRRPLEERFKNDESSVGEVLLMMRNDDDGTTELLEGLTSNVFVLYSNGTLVTPAEGMLEGCARNQVLCHARALGYKVKCAPIRLDSSVDQWEEVFCTSAIRLIIPVNKIVQLGGNEGEEVVWQCQRKPRKWRVLYNSIMMEALGVTETRSFCLRGMN